jgi:uncharacterized protein (DUF302 family)
MNRIPLVITFGVTLATALVLSLLQTNALAQPSSGMSKPAKPDFQVVVMSKYGFDDTVDILKGSMEQNNLMVVHELNAQKMLRMVNVRTKGMKQIMFFHPRFMKIIREINPHAIIEPPLKIAVMERPDGKVMIRYIKPTYLFGRYENLDDVGKELESLVMKIVASATN